MYNYPAAPNPKRGNEHMTSIIRTNIGSALLSLRKSKSISMREAAEQLKISHSAYSQYERGSSIPDMQTIFHASNYYHINIQFLVFLICVDLASLENIKNEDFFQLFTFDNTFDWDFFHVFKEYDRLSKNYKDAVTKFLRAANICSNRNRK